MNVYLLRFSQKDPFLLDGDLNYVKPDFPDRINVGVNPEKDDLLLFYHTFVGEGVNPCETVFAYFQVEKLENGIVYPSKTLTFDSARRGFGVLNFSRKRTLTRYGSPENYWSLPEFFKCMRLDARKSSGYREREGIRYFENTSPVIKVSVPVLPDSSQYFENALLEWASSLCEDIRSESTRGFNLAKKGSIGIGKTGFVKYSYRPDMRRNFYCRFNHIVGKRCEKLCNSCPMYKKEKGRHTCEWSLPLYGANPYIPLTVADAFAYFDVLLEKGLVMDYRD